MNRCKHVETYAWITFAVYLLVAAGKIIAARLAGSQAVLADGLNNITDSLNMIGIIIGIRYARRPADDQHRYGHQKSEAIATLCMSFMILYLGMEVTLKNLVGLFKGDYEAPNLTSALVSLVAGCILFLVYLVNRSAARKLNNLALKAVATDNLSDALISLVTAATVVISQLGLAWLDKLAAILVGLVILRSGWEIFTDSASTLMDGFPPEQIEKYQAVIMAVPGVKAITSIKGRQYGNSSTLDATILVNPDLTVKEGHDITLEVNRVLKKEFPDVDQCFIHVEPYMEPYISEKQK